MIQFSKEEEEEENYDQNNKAFGPNSRMPYQKVAKERLKQKAHLLASE